MLIADVRISPMPKQHPIRPFLLPWRLRKGWKQEKLAEALGISHSTVGRAEHGKSGVDDSTFAAIARAYDITPAELSMHPDEAERARELHGLLTAARTMDRDSLAALRTMAERMIPRKP